ncbi:hypothetical protein CYMTET_28829 [Cymbomonas tetramitiformis]|uniref:Uncharacterized protein n=1 Tax=Cymbomonas tetramitiformis TaxID=36881 RepID=A0AAE0KVI5_9CHLO|nr:hypothetical protein CYMTET_28829 [Cymbomonas tetramitiformis]
MRFVKSKEGTRHKDALGALYLAAPLQTVLEQVQERHAGVVISSYLDDAFFLGPPTVAALAYETYMEEAATIGLDIQPVKSAAFSPEGDASCFADGMPGARGELDFMDVLGVPVGKAEAVSAEMLKKVEELCAILPILNKLGHAQARGLLLRFIAHPSLGGCAGTEDLGAESDLPYVNSLQAAMQKVSEAMEVVEEARGVNTPLLPQVPKADDVKKLSDCSRSLVWQKQLQREQGGTRSHGKVLAVVREGRSSQSPPTRAEYDGDTQASYQRGYAFVWPNEPASSPRQESSPASSEEPASSPRSESPTSSTEEPIFCIQNQYSAHLVGGDCDDLPSRTTANTFP